MSGPSPGPVLGATPDVVAFDVLGTLFSLSAIEPRLAEAGGDPSVLELWFARLTRDGVALGLAGDWRAFPEVAKASSAPTTPGHGSRRRPPTATPPRSPASRLSGLRC